MEDDNPDISVRFEVWARLRMKQMREEAQDVTADANLPPDRWPSVMRMMYELEQRAARQSKGTHNLTSEKEVDVWLNSQSLLDPLEEARRDGIIARAYKMVRGKLRFFKRRGN